MTAIKLTPAQRRRMQKLAAAADRASQADRRFFERFPERRHRIRLASGRNRAVRNHKRRACVGSAGLLGSYCGVPGVRVRLYVWRRGHDSTDSEEIAREIFEAAASSKTRSQGAKLRQAAGARP